MKTVIIIGYDYYMLLFIFYFKIIDLLMIYYMARSFIIVRIYALFSIIWMHKLRSMRLVRHTACMTETIYTNRQKTSEEERT
jgi:hypothetical protein